MSWVQSIQSSMDGNVHEQWTSELSESERMCDLCSRVSE